MSRNTDEAADISLDNRIYGWLETLGDAVNPLSLANAIHDLYALDLSNEETRKSLVEALTIYGAGDPLITQMVEEYNAENEQGPNKINISEALEKVAEEEGAMFREYPLTTSQTLRKIAEQEEATLQEHFPLDMLDYMIPDILMRNAKFSDEERFFNEELDSDLASLTTLADIESDLARLRYAPDVDKAQNYLITLRANTEPVALHEHHEDWDKTDTAALDGALELLTEKEPDLRAGTAQGIMEKAIRKAMEANPHLNANRESELALA